MILSGCVLLTLHSISFGSPTNYVPRICTKILYYCRFRCVFEFNDDVPCDGFSFLSSAISIISLSKRYAAIPDALNQSLNQIPF